MDIIKWEFLRTKFQNYEIVPVVEKRLMSPYILTGFRTYGQMKHSQPVSEKKTKNKNTFSPSLINL